MKLRPGDVRFLGKQWIILLVLVGLLAACSVIYWVVQASEAFPNAYITDKILLFSLALLNLLLCLIIAFILLRNLIKLFIERRRGILGTKFQTKLVVAFLGFCLLPAVILFAAALNIIRVGIDRFFNTSVDDLTAAAEQVAEDYYASHLARSQQLAERVAGRITRDRLLDQPRQTRLRRLLRERQREDLLDVLGLYLREEEPLLFHHPDAQHLDQFAQPPPDLMGKAFAGTLQTWRDYQGSHAVLTSLVPVASTFNDQTVAVLAAGVVLPRDISRQSAYVVKASQDYKQSKLLKEEIKQVHVLFFALVTLLVVFSASWIAMYLARGITVPIQRLAEGTEEVREGNLDFQVDLTARDEMGILVESFNHMVRNLKFHTEETERATQDLRASHRELEQRGRYIETLLENLTLGVISLDADGRVVTANAAAARILGLHPHHRRQVEYRRFFRGAVYQPILEGIEQLLETGHATLSREMVLNLGHKVCTLAVSFSPLKDGEGRYLGMILVLEDLTQLIKAQQIAAWREVARRLAHEIKNPLTPIQLSAQRILKSYRAGSDQFDQILREGNETIIREVNNLKQLVQEFSKFARMPTVQLAPGDVNAVIDSALALYQDLHDDVTFRRHLGEDFPPVALDQEQLRRALINIIDNAIDAMGRRGTIEVASRFLTEEGVVQITIADDGPGISVEDKAKLFVPYFTRKAHGSGLGLAIVYRIIMDHNGSIRVEDNQPRGSRFVINLPLEQRRESKALSA